MNLREEINKLKQEGYNDDNAEARLCQDIILFGIANSNLGSNVTIKGGVVLRNISNNVRRATQDLDLDFIKYSISNESIEAFVRKLNVFDDIDIRTIRSAEELNHRDYKGKRVYVSIKDNFGNNIESKIDIGVHKDIDIEQEEYCFDICFQDDGASLLMNSKEQIITEKLKSLLRFGTGSTRYKDIFDIYYLSKGCDLHKLNSCIKRYIYEDDTIAVNNKGDIDARLGKLLESKTFIKRIEKSKKNWVDVPVTEVLEANKSFFGNTGIL